MPSRHEGRRGILLVTVGAAVLLSAACGGAGGRDRTASTQTSPTLTAAGNGRAPTSEGRTSVELTPQPTPNGTVDSQAIDAAVEVIRHRLVRIGIVGAEVIRAGGRIEVSIPGRGRNDVAHLVAQPGQLSVRQVLTAAPAAAAAPPASPSPTGSATVQSSDRPTGTVTLRQQFATVDCSAAVQRQNGDPDPQAEIVACERDGTIKYLLGPAEVLGTDVRTATATVDQGLNQGQILLDFNGKGTREFADLTRRVQPRPEMGSAGCQPPTGCNAVAVVLDGVVLSAPRIAEPITGGRAQIAGNLSQHEDADLASILTYGPLPLAFETSPATSTSPSPGTR